MAALATVVVAVLFHQHIHCVCVCVCVCSFLGYRTQWHECGCRYGCHTVAANTLRRPAKSECCATTASHESAFHSLFLSPSLSLYASLVFGMRTCSLHSLPLKSPHSHTHTRSAHMHMGSEDKWGWCKMVKKRGWGIEGATARVRTPMQFRICHCFCCAFLLPLLFALLWRRRKAKNGKWKMAILATNCAGPRLFILHFRLKKARTADVIAYHGQLKPTSPQSTCYLIAIDRRKPLNLKHPNLFPSKYAYNELHSDRAHNIYEIYSVAKSLANDNTCIFAHT